MNKPPSGSRAFQDFLKRLVGVPKSEIEAQEKTFREKRDADEYKEQRRPVVPTPSQRPH